MKYVKRGLLLLLMLTIGLFALYKIKFSDRGVSSPPEIEDSIEDFHVRCDFTDDDLLYGLTAFDDKDGDITDRIMSGEFTPLENENTSAYNCVVFDSDGQYCEYTRKVTFDDYVQPRISLSEPLLYYLGDGTKQQPRALLSASDKLDGDITYRIQMSDSNVDYRKTGDYLMRVRVDNSFGDIVEYELPMHVRVKSSDQYINLKQYIAYCRLGSAFDPMKYVGETSLGYSTPANPLTIMTNSNVNTDKEGVYEVEYTFYNDTKGTTATTFLTVIVRE